MNDARPDPDDLLARVQAEAHAAKRGHLRIYFGASAGVGKTFAMLSAARKRLEERPSTRIAIGIIETHGRSETAALLAGLRVIDRKRIEHLGRVYEEFDLDTVLAERPDLAIVDELAHTNAPGSRHPKRWQDVEELRDAGIDVWTTLNVQHLESLNEVVGGITGIRVAETLPDAVVDSADEIMLVDITADELLARLRAGKVYLPEQAERAAANFFRKGNLIALREIALRRVADRVEDEVQAYRESQSIAPAWKTEAALLACVDRVHAAAVVRATARFASQLNVEWHAVSVDVASGTRAQTAASKAVFDAMKLAGDLGATTAMLAHDDAAQAWVDYARDHNISRMVVARATQRSWPWRRPLAERIAHAMPEADLISIAPAQTPQAPERPAPSARVRADHAAAWPRYAWASLAAIAPTLLAAPLSGVLELANIVMFFLLAVLFVGYRYGRGPAVLAAFLNVVAFDFFFVPPRFSFAVTDAQYLVVFTVMLATGLATGQLTANLRRQAQDAREREARARAMFELARKLSGHLQIEQIVETTLASLARSFDAEVVLLIPDAADQLRPAARNALPSTLDSGIARWSYDRAQPAGLETDTLPGSPWRFEPMRAPMRVRGVIALKPAQPASLKVPEQERLLETIATLVAIALERVHYVEVAGAATLHVEAQRLHNSLLAALSHDLRTPLAALVGLADTLERTPPGAPRNAELAHAIAVEARRMNALVANLLDMARLETGQITLKNDWQSIEEVIGSALESVRAALDGRAVQVDLPPELPLVRFDAVLIERVLANLLENAAKYAPAPAAISIRVEFDDARLNVAVLDTGPGLPPGSEGSLFEKFVRGQTESATPGLGLGLAICRAIVIAHGGGMRAVNRREGGASFSFWLPRTEAPSMDDAAATGGAGNPSTTP